jgi:hypothetical protein
MAQLILRAIALSFISVMLLPCNFRDRKKQPFSSATYFSPALQQAFPGNDHILKKHGNLLQFLSSCIMMEPLQ